MLVITLKENMGLLILRRTSLYSMLNRVTASLDVQFLTSEYKKTFVYVKKGTLPVWLRLRTLRCRDCSGFGWSVDWLVGCLVGCLLIGLGFVLWFLLGDFSWVLNLIT